MGNCQVNTISIQPILARVKCALIDQQGGHAGGLARLNAYPGVFKHQAVGRVGAELLGHFQEGVRVGLVIDHIIGTHQHGDEGIEPGLTQDVRRMFPG